MKKIESLNDLKEKFQAVFDYNEETLEIFGKTYSNQVKAYLLEINDLKIENLSCPDGKWKKIDDAGWFTNNESENSGTYFLDATRNRVWIIYSIIEALESDVHINNLIKKAVENSQIITI